MFTGAALLLLKQRGAEQTRSFGDQESTLYWLGGGVVGNDTATSCVSGVVNLQHQHPGAYVGHLRAMDAQNPAWSGVYTE